MTHLLRNIAKEHHFDAKEFVKFCQEYDYGERVFDNGKFINTFHVNELVEAFQKSQQMTKHPNWKQLNPFDQLTCLRMAIEFNIDDLEHKDFVDRSILQAKEFLNQIKQLEPFLKKGSW